MSPIPPHERPTARQLAAQSSGTENPGLCCPRCGARAFTTEKTIQQREKTIRYRRCFKCSHAVITKEEFVRDVVPKKKSDDIPTAGNNSLKLLRETA